MQKAIDLTAVQAVLQHGLNRGLWTVDDLDSPSPDYLRQLADARQSKFFGSDFTPDPLYVNPLRSRNNAEVVQPINPRDFDVAAATRPNEGQQHVDLQPLQWPPVPGERYGSDLVGDQKLETDRGDHGEQAHLGATREPHPPDPGSVCPPSLEPESALWPLGAAPW